MPLQLLPACSAFRNSRYHGVIRNRENRFLIDYPEFLRKGSELLCRFQLCKVTDRAHAAVVLDKLILHGARAEFRCDWKFLFGNSF